MEIIEKAPAKINLGLDVLHKREDGYHELEMVMSSVDLADHLSFERLPEDQIVIESNKAFLPIDHRNNVYQAAAIIKKRYDVTEGIKITIQKNIPVAAGLGGGSTDCAATLRGLNRLWSLNLSMEEMIDIGMHVGTDVPYCLYGTTSFIAGKGEIVKELRPMPPCWVILVKPRMSVSTRKIFQQVDMTRITHPDMKNLAAAILKQDYQEMLYYMGNSLEDVTIPKHQVIQQIKTRMIKYGADAALMSGSGPTVFALCQKQSRAKRIVNAVKGFCDEVYMVRTLN
ncbi:4-(cytidine 5'-diphospho)-2-C-methyl-D-erythritol kinase [Tetragenococcus koreensis]|uniref:4-diphosphocytidyl-2-C-methyl-D-erythritol kinase n=1 Tax=Tetragenococcus koreensis TaxID=290335 RepID=A0AAN4UAL5_9ENTE|nr:4-(cytidine 5'-diphospho)-2-C-methyl-D-erythritol kinase [Tetragenococcus koreensis]AYW46288.1 4-(cytidine 5'-diphospho)-2-C-methyl-D-erythritol kinase [Tetragenococcus koreensis]MCF1585838.1 4-(cytidine 5'-diphospho)-2-C-methyl-D-erythritol kinase [Tetragenococcus koreensis]MCF1615412.1 4-(cytidine 5'-diphospho)-2-C-methyl-D-erythritol kinase [Tetragenococcus koreensis]MCF1617942.1 4-(cytidine 5'-diphospho)-2-C-methyl-D-erythritol kinase [Tetragenococcus koreensis]MCF1619395.1 4-(cytidine 